MLSHLKIDSHSLVNLALSVEWRSAFASHQDVLVFEKFNVWRDLDLLPEVLQKNLLGKATGYKEAFSFEPQALLPAWSKNNLHSIAPQLFRKTLRQGFTIQPHTGRFYPKGLVGGVREVYSEDMHPCRLVAMDETSMTFDFNHPLAQYALTIGVEVNSVVAHSGEHGGRCNDAIADLLNGPGMQARYGDRPTDFFTGTPFKRVDEGKDSLFYSMPRMVQHLDKTARQQVENLYASLIPPQSRILDLMSSFDSHLPDSIKPLQVTGLGMHQQELAANRVLNERVVHDLNTDIGLPFENAMFDAVICTASIEYLTQPGVIFEEVARVLKPGGLFINTFSNRWFPVKAISVWAEMHEFERIGLVSEYYLQSGCFNDVHTHSIRGLSRPEDDVNYAKTAISDPVYAVWGRTVQAGKGL
ncbi:MAG: methyltransferase domain-containing protein [Gammaproteobacteria bacterium]|nr:methyltransferase domain-containing protein [Gammaproteobacteria bacterium]